MTEIVIRHGRVFVVVTEGDTEVSKIDITDDGYTVEELEEMVS